MYLDQNNVPFYVGKGKDSRYKVSGHLSKSTTNSFLKNKINKVGSDNVKIHFLHTNLTEKGAFRWERYWIKYIGRRDLKEGSLCNLTDGGEGPSPSKETKRKISSALKGRKSSSETRQKISNSLKGQKSSMQTCQKISAAFKGRKFSDEHKQKLCEAHQNREVSVETRDKISSAMRGEKNHMYGKKRLEETKRKISQANKGKVRSMAQRKKISKGMKQGRDSKCR